ncbi:Uncharacterised protein [Vibrio cholerae]|nr:Uncharacterised protein [Vibrio cholerae]
MFFLIRDLAIDLIHQLRNRRTFTKAVVLNFHQTHDIGIQTNNRIHNLGLLHFKFSQIVGATVIPMLVSITTKRRVEVVEYVERGNAQIAFIQIWLDLTRCVMHQIFCRDGVGCNQAIFVIAVAHNPFEA